MDREARVNSPTAPSSIPIEVEPLHLDTVPAIYDEEIIALRKSLTEAGQRVLTSKANIERLQHELSMAQTKAVIAKGEMQELAHKLFDQMLAQSGLASSNFW